MLSKIDDAWEGKMVSEHLVGKHVPDIVGAIFKRLGRTGQKLAETPEHFVIGGRIKHVEIARRTLALDADGRLY